MKLHMNCPCKVQSVRLSFVFYVSKHQAGKKNPSVGNLIIMIFV